MSDLWLFIVTIVLLAVTGGAAVALAVFSGGLRTRVRDIVGTTIVLGVLLEGTFVVILSEHFLEQFKSH
jgi:hypothetical protein